MRSLNKVLRYFESLVSLFPGTAGTLARKVFWASLLKELGPKANFGFWFRAFGSGSIVIGGFFGCDRLCCLNACAGGAIRIGNRVSLASNVTINAACHGVIEIGDDVMIGPNTVLRSSDHGFDSTQVPMNQQPHQPGIIRISEDVWLGANVTVVGNVSIGRGVVVGAGSVVTKDVPEFQIVAGVPAKLIRSRLES